MRTKAFIFLFFSLTFRFLFADIQDKILIPKIDKKEEKIEDGLFLNDEDRQKAKMKDFIRKQLLEKSSNMEGETIEEVMSKKVNEFQSSDRVYVFLGFDCPDMASAFKKVINYKSANKDVLVYCFLLTDASKMMEFTKFIRENTEDLEAIVKKYPNMFEMSYILGEETKGGRHDGFTMMPKTTLPRLFGIDKVPSMVVNLRNSNNQYRWWGVPDINEALYLSREEEKNRSMTK